MGCCSSREASSLPPGNEQSLPGPREARLVSTHATTSQTPLSQTSNHAQSPGTSRAAIDPISSTSLPSGSAISSSHQSASRHRTRSHQESSPSNLSEHYNVPLQHPKSWKSQSRIWTSTQLRQERQDFFDTRVTGQTEVWEALRQVAECIREGDLPTAQGILNAINVTLPTGQLEDGCYDERGFLYKIPEEVLTNPSNLQPDQAEVDGETVVEVPTDAGPKLSSDTLDKQPSSMSKAILEKSEVATSDKGKDAIPADAISIKCRMSDRGSDVPSYIRKTENLAQLATRIKENIKIPRYSKIEFFYLGKKLDQKKTLEEQDFVQGHVLNVFVVGAPR